MKRITVSPNFYLDEFLDPYTYLKEKDNGLDQLDFKLFQIAQKVREMYGQPLYINTWWDFYQLKKDTLSIDQIISQIENSNSLRKWSGLRTSRSNVGGKNSAHRKGMAIDLKGNGQKLYEVVKDNAKELYCAGLRRIEDKKITTTWLHADTWEKNTKPNSIRVVDLTKCTETIYF